MLEDKPYVPNSISTADELFLYQLQVLYDLENQLLITLPLLAEHTASPGTRQVFQQHLRETQRQKNRLERAFHFLAREPAAAPCQGIAGIVAEIETMLQAIESEPLRERALLSAGRKMEHYELVVYNEARRRARELGYLDVAELLEVTLQEEEAIDQLLASMVQNMWPLRRASDGPSGASRSER